jgi:Zn-dependent alcohol dehydrogenase
LSTALGTINNEAELKFGESIMVVGCGGVGLNLIQGAKMASAYPIIGVDNSEEKRNMALSLGATRFINPTTESMSDVRVDVVVDTTGNLDAIQSTVCLLSDKGRYILVGQPKPGESVSIPNAYTMFGGNGKTIKATQGGNTVPNDDIPRYAKLHKAGLLDIDRIITHVFPLDQINDALDTLRAGKAGRIMIKMD